MTTRIRDGVALEVLRAVMAGQWPSLDMSSSAVRQAVGLLRKRGYIERPVIPTAAGTQALADWEAEEPALIKRRAARAERLANVERAAEALIQPARTLSCAKHPLAATNEQINEIKRKANEDRSFGFESINGHSA